MNATLSLEFILEHLVLEPSLHAKWINTLSYLENCGAKLIASCQHPTIIKEEMLKHASEEFRHAHYLKTQIQRISAFPLSYYTKESILGGYHTLYYLKRLDLMACRFLKDTLKCSTSELKALCYLFVTYAIEKRALELYPLYHLILKKNNSPITVKSILLEEEEHLEEMKQGIECIPNGWKLSDIICSFENKLSLDWLEAIEKELKAPCDL